MKTENLTQQAYWENNLGIETKDGGVYVVHSQFIANVDHNGNYDGSVGCGGFDKLQEMLDRHGSFAVRSRDWDNKTPVRIFTKDEIKKLYTVPAHPSKESVVEVKKPKQSLVGKALVRLSDLVR